ncbi:MAG: glycosyltransferase family 39 protein [Candidatus Micrarchaeota archaeon]
MVESKQLAFPVALAVLSLSALAASYYTTANNAAYWWDEAEYGILSKGLSTEGFFGFFGGISYRPPFLPVYIAIFRALIGESAWLILIPVFSAMSAAILLVIGRKMFGLNAAIISCTLMLCSTLFIFYSGRMLTEIPGIFFTILSIHYLFMTLEGEDLKNPILLGIFTLLGLLVYYRFMLVMFSMAVFVLVFKTRSIAAKIKPFLLAIGVFVIGMIPLFAYANSYFGGPLGIFTLTYSVGEPVPWDYFFTILPHILSNIYLVGLLILGILYSVFYGSRPMKYLASLSLIILLSASLLLNHKEDRYLMPMFPAVFLLVGAFAYEAISKAISKIKNFRMGSSKFEVNSFQIGIGILVVVLLYLSSLGNLASAGEIYDGKKASFGDVKDAALYVRENTLPTDVLMTDSVTAMFHSDRPSKGFISSNLTMFLDDLKNHKPAYLLITAYESRDLYVNALNNYKSLANPTNSIEYVLLNPSRFQLMKVFPSETNPYIMVFKVIG